MRVLFDTNVILDVLLARAPHAAPATTLLDLVSRKELDGWLGATTLTTIFYLVAKMTTPAQARRHVHTLLDVFEIAPVTRPVLAEALDPGFKDYEDAVLHAAARQAGATAIVTRDPGGFASSKLRIYSPANLLRLVEAAR